jgi:hypothetical protein
MTLTQTDIKNKLGELQHIKKCAARWFWNPYVVEDPFNVRAIEVWSGTFALIAFLMAKYAAQLSIENSFIAASAAFTLACAALSVGLIAMLRAREGADSALDKLLSAYQPVDKHQYQALKAKATLFCELSREDVFQWIEAEHAALLDTKITDSNWSFARADAPMSKSISL